MKEEQAYEIAGKTAIMYEYLTSEWGWSLVACENKFGKIIPYFIGAGNRDADEIFWVKCPGIGNLDMSWFREGWNSEGLNDKDVILECIKNGDMTNWINSLGEKIWGSYQEHMAWEEERENAKWSGMKLRN